MMSSLEFPSLTAPVTLLGSVVAGYRTYKALRSVHATATATVTYHKNKNGDDSDDVHASPIPNASARNTTALPEVDRSNDTIRWLQFWCLISILHSAKELIWYRFAEVGKHVSIYLCLHFPVVSFVFLFIR